MNQIEKFNENFTFYDKHRPTYIDELYCFVLNYSSFSEGKAAIEVGCGTGQATKPFLETGAKVTAFELGADLADFTRNKFAGYQNLDVINQDFMNYTTDDCSVDLIYSATAFHWVSDANTGLPGYRHAYQMLKPGGTLAVWWNNPRASGQNLELEQEIQEVYRKYAPSLADTAGRKTAQHERWFVTRCVNLQRLLHSNGFCDVKFELYYDWRNLTPENYIGLLHTYSDHMALSDKERIPLFDNIQAIIEKHGSITLLDTMDLHMGRK